MGIRVAFRGANNYSIFCTEKLFCKKKIVQENFNCRYAGDIKREKIQQRGRLGNKFVC